MKKIMSLVLALALVLSMGVTVFAEEHSGSTTVTDPANPENNSKSINVTAGYTAPSYTVEKTVYHVVVAWQKSGTIKYVGDNFTYTWNPETGDNGEYTKNGTAAHWEVSPDAKVAITVTNKSNAAITATCGAPAAKTDTGVTGIEGHYGDTTDQTAELKLESAAPATVGPNTTEEQLKGTVRKGNATYTITGVNGAISQDNVVIATISVTIAKDTTSNSEG